MIRVLLRRGDPCDRGAPRPARSEAEAAAGQLQGLPHQGRRGATQQGPQVTHRMTHRPNDRMTDQTTKQLPWSFLPRGRSKHGLAGRQAGRRSANQQRGAAAGRSNARWFTLLGCYLRSQIRAVSMQRAEGTEHRDRKEKQSRREEPQLGTPLLGSPCLMPHAQSPPWSPRPRHTSRQPQRATRHAACSSAPYILGFVCC